MSHVRRKPSQEPGRLTKRKRRKKFLKENKKKTLIIIIILLMVLGSIGASVILYALGLI